MSATNPNARLEAFSDGVFAIAITLLVIEVKLPSPAEIHTTDDFWHALTHIAPSIFSYLLSFAIILITWVNHHNHLRLMNKSCTSYLYANGLLLLAVAFFPFPTSLLGEFILTDHSAPAVILYNATLTVSALGWIVLNRTALSNQLCKSEAATQEILRNHNYGYYAFGLYSLCTIAAYWFPFSVAIFTTLTWILWFIVGVRMKHE